MYMPLHLDRSLSFIAQGGHDFVIIIPCKTQLHQHKPQRKALPVQRTSNAAATCIGCLTKNALASTQLSMALT